MLYKCSTGAFNSIKESHRRSQEAQSRVDQTTDTIRHSESVREQVEELIRDKQSEFDRDFNSNEGSLKDLDVGVGNLSSRIVELNNIVS